MSIEQDAIKLLTEKYRKQVESDNAYSGIIGPVFQEYSKNLDFLKAQNDEFKAKLRLLYKLAY